MAVKFSMTFTGGADNTPLISGEKRQSLINLENLCKALAGGIGSGSAWVLDCRNAAVAASGTLTYSANPAINDTVTIAGTAFTAVASASTNVQYTIGGSATATAANFATVVNAHPTIGQYVTASANGTTVTITANTPGIIGNLITLAESGANTSVSGAALSGGSESRFQLSF